MTSAELIGQIRFALSELTGRNAAHEFEEACRHYTRQRIASNVLPASGPVGAHGDQGRDFETFRSYLRDELGPHGAFLALVSDGPLVFACTIKATGLTQKVREDVAAITTQGTAVQRVYFFSVGTIAVGTRHELQAEIRREHDVELEIIDGLALSEHLADEDLFWIAQQHLRLPAEIAPPRTLALAESHGPPAWYVADRARWRERGHALPTPGQLLDLCDGLRYSTNHLDARADLPFWLDLVSELTVDAPQPVQARARYELAVAQIQGLGDLAPADVYAASFIEEGITGEDPVRLGDCAVLLSFATVAFTAQRTAFERERLASWSMGLRTRVSELLDAGPSPTARARLLEVLGNLCFAVDPARVGQAPQQLDLPEVSELRDESGRPRLRPGLDPKEAADAMVDVEQGMRAWLDLAVLLPDTPLFPLERLAQMLELYAPFLVEQPGWRELADAVDAALARTQGSAAAAERNYGRARSLLEAERLLDAIGEIHQAKVAWWSGDHLRPSLMMLLLLGECYARLGMSVAAKQYALAAANIPLGTGADELMDIVPHALLRASAHEYHAGSWCAAVQLARLGTIAQHQLIDESVDGWAEKDAQDAMMTMGMTLLAARAVFSEQAPLTEQLTAITSELDMLEGFEWATRDSQSWSAREWVETCRDQLHGGPFDDVGEERVIRFAALGLQFSVRCANEWADVLAAERLVASAQVLLVELASLDLCLLPTAVELRVAAAAEGRAGSVENVSGNDGRRWEVTLARYTPGTNMDVEATSLELLTVLSQVLLDVSLLPTDDFMAGVERAFATGLQHKLTAGRPYDELAAAIDAQTFEQLPRRTVEPPADEKAHAASEHGLLAWQDGPGPTLTREQLDLLIANRYQMIPELMGRTLPRLRPDKRFAGTVAVLHGRGWRDWHILTAIYNILLQRRLEHAGLTSESAILTPAGRRSAAELAYTPEAEDEPEVPLGIFLNVSTMDDARRWAIASLLHNIELELHSDVPDLPAIERLLAARYGYWSDDVEHDDPFGS